MNNSPGLPRLREILSAIYQQDISSKEIASQFEQVAECCSLTACWTQQLKENRAAQSWLINQAPAVLKDVFRDCFAFDGVALLDAEEPSKNILFENRAIYYYEKFLQDYDPVRRARYGVYYTPQPLVKFIVRSIDEQLQLQFGLSDGLADTTTWGEIIARHPHLKIPARANNNSPFVQILDPAAGTGAFLVEVVGLVHGTMLRKWQQENRTAGQVANLWNRYVTQDLLPRITGLELMLAPCAIAHMNLAAKLAETGFSFDTDQQVNLFLADTLADPLETQDLEEIAAGEFARLKKPVTVVLGNPPFCADSKNQSRWIEGLMRGRNDDEASTANYYEIDGKPLGERKVWLHDDYVKFIRYAHWQIKRTGCGIVGYVTNHGFLDNPTFRGMRRALLNDFQQINIIDLHGNRKKKECSPNGEHDENIFSIEQGLAVSLLSRRFQESLPTELRYSELWGKKENKLRLLKRNSAATLPAVSLSPTKPYYFYVPHDDSLREEYEQGFKLTEAMPIGSTAAVTARDHFVIAQQPETLMERIDNFCNLEIADEEIRRRYFTNGRSTKYPPGDTRGWKLNEARRRLADDKLAAGDNWPEMLTNCLYRPFDSRAIYWSKSMIDWPRDRVMRHIQVGNNMALIARRQMPSTQLCNYFWITDQIALDGVIRSDNRGSESFFPLYLYSNEFEQGDGVGPQRCANFSESFICQAEYTLSLRWLEDGRGDLQRTFGPEDMLHYIYALFFDEQYRKRYANFLRIDFPRIFLPRVLRLFRDYCHLGQKLVKLHLLRDEKGELENFHFEDETVVARGYPKYSNEKVYINKKAWFTKIPLDVWNYHVGAYQVCRKWLKDRRGKNLSPKDIATYCQIVAALKQTIELSKSITASSQQHGGWPAAFHCSAISGQCSTDADHSAVTTGHC